MSRTRRRSRPVPRPRTPINPRKRHRSPPWVGGAIAALFVLGIAWLVVFYTTAGSVPVIRDLKDWNILIGFGLICCGFGLATQWR